MTKNNCIQLPQCSVKGNYRAVLTDEFGNVKVDTGWNKNLLTDLGLQQLQTASRPFNNLWVGSGTTPATYADTSMDTRFGTYKSANSLVFTKLTSPPYGVKTNFDYVMGGGVNTGTITEIGTSAWANYQTDVGNICMRVVLPTPIVKGALDTLTVYYEYYFYVDHADVVGTIDIQGVTYNYTARLYGADNMYNSYGPGGSYTGSFAVSQYWHFLNSTGSTDPYPYLVAVTGASRPGSQSRTYACTSIGYGAITGNGTIGYSREQTFVWDIDRANEVGANGGIRTIYLTPNWSAYNVSSTCGVQISIGKVSDGSTHPKEDTHEFSFTASTTTVRLP